MATFKDINGVFGLDTDGGGSPVAVGELVSATVDETSGSVESTAVGDSWRTNDSGLKGYTISGEMHYDFDDTEDALVEVGAKLEWNGLVNADGPVLDATLSGKAVITSVGINIAGLDEVTVKKSFTAIGDGALVKA